VHIVRQVPEPDFNFRPSFTNGSQYQVSGDLRLNTEYMLDTAPYL